MPDKPKSTPPAQAAAAAQFKRGVFSLNFKFSLFTGGMLAALLVLVTLMVSEQLQRELILEVAERGRAVATNLALKMGDALSRNDIVPIVQQTKGSLENSAPADTAELGLAAGILADLTRSMGGAMPRNEGIERVVVVKYPGNDDLDKRNVYFDEDSSGHSVLDQPDLVLPHSEQFSGEPFPVASMNGRQFYEITQPVTVVVESSGSKQVGEVHLYLRRDIISNAVRTATTRMVAVMLVSLLLGVLGLWVVVRMLMGPIKHLVRGVNAVAKGDFGVQLGIRRGDELGDLVDSYNGMARSLREKEAVQEALAKYTSKDLVNQMLSDKAQLELGGQRVFATILFSVVRGMHALSATMPAEEYVGLINEYLEVETEAIMRNGGSIDKFIGDEVMAVWGLGGTDSPAARVQAAVQAVKAGIEAQAAVEKLNAARVKRGEQPFLISIGINNGEVVSGNMGSSVKMDYTVLGGNVNLAARLGLVAAQAGQTIISQSVYELVAAKFRVDKLAPVPLKGIKDPVPLFWPRQALP
ncbi:MAG TPA: adenylate/guanylate cyclase domain-containing protein [bacterium]|nr:adenylate/guanylate cyclase domain-containing protein [bacterium]